MLTLTLVCDPDLDSGLVLTLTLTLTWCVADPDPGLVPKALNQCDPDLVPKAPCWVGDLSAPKWVEPWPSAQGSLLGG